MEHEETCRANADKAENVFFFQATEEGSEVLQSPGDSANNF